MEEFVLEGSMPGKTGKVTRERVRLRVVGAQDGAVWSNVLFRFDSACNGYAYRADTFAPLGVFMLDKADVFAPHGNAVCFSHTYYDNADEFPLLYTNVYNNYEFAEGDRMEGTCGVYRLFRTGDTFASTLIQIVRVGFTDDPLWRSANKKDIRPFGNAVVDTDRNELVFFTMRDEEQNTRFFRFPLPEKTAGTVDPRFGVPVATLEKSDVIASFDCPYFRFLQGAAYDGGMVYSTEGFEDDANPACIRIVDLEKGEQIVKMPLRSWGHVQEAELIDVQDGSILYGDNRGNLFRFKMK